MDILNGIFKKKFERFLKYRGFFFNKRILGKNGERAEIEKLCGNRQLE